MTATIKETEIQRSIFILMEKKIKKVVLAYSGGLDTSAMLLWIKETYGAEVVCFCADVGQGEELSGLEEKTLKTGASKLYVEDLREEFVRDYVWTAVKANALYEGVYLLGTSLARPVIAKKQIEIAVEEGAQIVHAIFEHRQPIDPGAEREPLPLIWVEPAIGDHARVNHSAAQHFHPAFGPSDHTAAFFGRPADVDFGRGLGEREIARAQAEDDVVALEKRFQKGLECPF